MTDETVDAWFARYHAYRTELGRVPTVGIWRMWISPHIGAMRMVDVTAEDIERVRDALDEAILAWQRGGVVPGVATSGCSAMGIWWTLSAAFRAASRSKRRDLRILAGRPNPCEGVEPPGDARTRRARSKTFVYPSEAKRLFACELVPLAWREAHAIAAYTYLRPNELRVLRWSDVDLRHRRVHVTRAWSIHMRSEKPPKTRGGIRDVPFASTLLPLLERMARGRRPEDLVVPIVTSHVHETLAWRMREHLRIAGITRAALYTSTRETVRANWRSWRDSGVTWLAMSGVGIVQMMRRAGHVDPATTSHYTKLAEDLGGELGEPFGPLPTCLVEGASPPAPMPRWCRTARTKAKPPATS